MFCALELMIWVTSAPVMPSPGFSVDARAVMIATSAQVVAACSATSVSGSSVPRQAPNIRGASNEAVSRVVFMGDSVSGRWGVGSVRDAVASVHGELKTIKFLNQDSEHLGNVDAKY